MDHDELRAVVLCVTHVRGSCVWLMCVAHVCGRPFQILEGSSGAGLIMLIFAMFAALHRVWRVWSS